MKLEWPCRVIEFNENDSIRVKSLGDGKTWWTTLNHMYNLQKYVNVVMECERYLGISDEISIFTQI